MKIFVVYWGVKSTKNAKFCDIVKLFLAIFGKHSGQRVCIILRVSYLIMIYNFCFISFVRISTFF